jgi:twinkle protein
MQNTKELNHRGSKLVEREACPKCQAEGRDTAGDNLAVYDDGHKYCYACKYFVNSKGIEEDLTEFTFEYLPSRGISKETFQHYDVKTKIDVDGKPVALGFRHPNGATFVRYFELDENGKRKQEWTGTVKPEPGLFGRDKFSAGTHKYVTVTEGREDALSLYEVLKGPVVSIQSSSTAARDCSSPVDRAFLNSFERIYLAFDDDEQGRHAVREVSRLFDYNKIYHVRFDGKRGRKDANEYLSQGEGDDLRRIWWNSKLYLPDTIISGLDDFERILSGTKRVGVPYPFDILNKFTFGIRTGETVLITAQEKVGKTELMHFIEHQLLKVTNENVGAFFLEEPQQRQLQALAGIEAKIPFHLPERDYPSSEVAAALKAVVKVDGRLHLYTHFGSDDPMVFLDTIRFLATARNCRYILIDHISMVTSGILGHHGGDERKQLDYLSTRLEMMVKELDVALIMVSHVNDFGQTRGSRWLTKVCDLQINATRDLMADNPEVRNTINLSVPISRYPGLTGYVGGLVFDRDTYTFREVAANDNNPEERNNAVAA